MKKYSMGSPKLLYLFMFMYVLYVFPEVSIKLTTGKLAKPRFSCSPGQKPIIQEASVRRKESCFNQKKATIWEKTVRDQLKDSAQPTELLKRKGLKWQRGESLCTEKGGWVSATLIVCRLADFILFRCYLAP